jgi:chromosome partitioning protein
MSQKGGSGKTTLAVHVAVAAQQAGQRVAIVDADPQKSACVWGGHRADSPAVAAAADPVRMIASLRIRKTTDLCIIDVPPHATPEAFKIAQAVDLVVIPVRPTAFDLAAVPAILSIIRAARAQAAFVLSACPPRAPEIAEAREALIAHGFPVWASEITERRAFSRAIASGRAVTEFEAHGKAAAEIRLLAEWLGDRVNSRIKELVNA